MKNLLLPVGFLCTAGLVVLSALSMRLFSLQAMWIAGGLLLLFFLGRFQWTDFIAHRWLVWGLYGFVLVLLLLVLFLPPIRNIRSWIVLGPFTLQPVELMKVALILVYAQYFSKRHLAVARWKNILTSFACFAPPAALAILGPDLGSAIVFFGIWFGFLLVSGLPLRRIAAAVIIFTLGAVLAWYYVLHPYQKNRIRALFHPEEQSLTVNYSVIQSKIAIGSAGFWGKGYGQGTQTQLGFLSEPANDFILAALIEEWGLVAGLVALAAFLYFLLQILKIGLLANQNFEKFLCLGAAMVFGLQFTLNAGSTTGLLPVVGVTFPFLSYGGSSLLGSFLLLGIVSAIARRA